MHLSISLLILACFVAYAQRSGVARSSKVYEVGKRLLPGSYAICSKEGKKVYTTPEEGGVGPVECVVVDGKVVVDTGSLAKVRRRWADEAGNGAQEKQAAFNWRGRSKMPIVYLQPGHALTPGLTDSHGHILYYGFSRQLPLAGSKSIDEVISRVEAYVTDKGRHLPDGAWIQGMGWDQNVWDGQSYPTAADLEKSPILRGLPIELSRVDFHAVWLSQAILDQLGPLPRHVEGGQIVRDTAGNPTGVFVDNAVDLLTSIRPPWTDVHRTQYLELATQDALSKGLVGVHDARTTMGDLVFYRGVAGQGKLGLRVYGMIYCEESELSCGPSMPKLDHVADGRLTVKAVKLFADGALGSRGAALIEDYSDEPGWRGTLLAPEESWKPLVKEWYDAGWQVNIHAIGDLANKVALDAFESVLASDPRAANERRLRIEHAQIMTPADLARAAHLGVIGSYQPTHATSDMWYAEDRLGPERIKGAYAWKSYVAAGGRIALGSDFPVESIDPLKGFYAAVTRRSEDGRSPHGSGGWYPAEKLSREQALRGFTVNAAYAGFSNSTGSLTPGKRFDAVIWDDDLMTVDADEMLDVRVKATIMDGKLVYGRIDHA